MAAHQPPPSLGFSRQEYWSGLPFPSPMHACMLSRFSRGLLCATPSMAAHQAPPSMGFSRQEYWSWVPLPSPWFCEFTYFRRLLKVESCSICPVICSFHLVSRPQVSSMLLHNFFFFKDWIVCYCFSYHTSFMHFSVDELLVCFHILVSVNNAAVNMEVQMSLWDSNFNSLGWKLRSRTVGSYGSSISNFFEKLPHCFQ